MKQIYRLLILMPLLFSYVVKAEQNQDVVLKLRGLFSASNAKQTDLPYPYTPYAATANLTDRRKLFSSSIGGEASCAFFWNDFVATEFATGTTLYRQRATAVRNLQLSYNVNPILKKARDMLAIPSYASLQYHLAPYGAVRPYFGGGIHYTFLLSRTSNYSVSNGMGPLIQLGLDIVFKDDSYINFDIKSYSLKSKIKYNQAFISDQNGKEIISRMRIDPISIGLGIGFKF